MTTWPTGPSVPGPATAADAAFPGVGAGISGTGAARQGARDGELCTSG
jgi:hypothetical protein